MTNQLIQRIGITALFAATALGGFALGAPPQIFLIMTLPVALMVLESL